MKKLIFLPFIFSVLIMNAQQWGGNSNTTDLTHREGKVLVGGTSLMGSWGVGEGTVEIQSGFNQFAMLGFRNRLSTASFDIGFNSGVHAAFYAHQVPIRFITNGGETLRLNTNGTVGIGTSNTGSFKLAVEGKIGAREIKVTLDNPWPDYVFEDKYPLMNLADLDKYISINKHLPVFHLQKKSRMPMVLNLE